jgi:6,7-dimethyl-8-ribityllumazine synthase
MLQSHTTSKMPHIPNTKIVILQSKWYKEHTDLMSFKCRELLEKAGASVKINIIPGCLEIPLIAQEYLKHNNVDAFVCVGVLMKGQTDHYKMILESCVIGMQEVSLKNSIPLINAILPVNSIEQVIERASDNEYNKGIEAALAVGEYIKWKNELNK